MSEDILKSLEATLRARKGADPATSYVASLYAQGTNKILEKIGEEATEVILAAKDLDDQRDDSNTEALVKEVADLWFHSIVALAHLNVDLDDVRAELDRRRGVSGLTEKSNR